MTSSSCNLVADAGVRAATQQRWEDAERFFQIVLQQEPDSASAYSNLGNVHLSEGRAEEAVRDFSRAIAIAPTVLPFTSRLQRSPSSKSVMSLIQLCSAVGNNPALSVASHMPKRCNDAAVM